MIWTRRSCRGEIRPPSSNCCSPTALSSIGHRGVAKSDLMVPSEQRTEPVWYALRLPDERPGRAVSFFFAPRVDNGESDDDVEPRADAQQPAMQSDRTVAIVFARDTDRMKEALARLRWLLMLVGLASIAVSTSVLWWLVRQSMVPLERLAREINRIEANDLATSIDRETCPREIRPVVDRFNDLLVRLDAAFRRERAFSANVAHELRNPLAALNLKMDVARSRSRGANEYEEAIDQCRQITEGMRRMVENLLSLARLETGRIATRKERVHLDELIDELWKPLEAEAEERRLDVRWSMTRPLTLVSDASMAGLIVRNVLENAVSYADPGGSVEIAASTVRRGRRDYRPKQRQPHVARRRRKRFCPVLARRRSPDRRRDPLWIGALVG